MREVEAMQETKQLNPPSEPIRLGPYIGRGRGRFLSFLICCALLIGAFSVSGALANRDGALGGLSALFGEAQKQESPSLQLPEIPEPIRPTVPEGATPIRSADLSHSELGPGYLLNETHLKPDLSRLTGQIGERITYDPSDGPVVLILHTHASEAYLPSSADYLTEEIGKASYSDDQKRTVVAVGAVLCEELNKKGIPTIHCSEMHGDGGSLRHSYERAADCIQNYIDKYPTIRFVIDLHRDGILDADGAYVRTVSIVNGEEVAQIMAVVGTDCNGEDYPHWQENFVLAMRLREGLCAISPSLARPIYLRRSSYNQEIAPRSLLLEIGSGANTVEEAMRAARYAAQVLADLFTYPN
jgi:stage II sporulation protein P